MDVNEAFSKARDYLTKEPILADLSSIELVIALPFSGDNWAVACNYKRRGGTQIERAMIMMNAEGKFVGFAKMQ